MTTYRTIAAGVAALALTSVGAQAPMRFQGTMRYASVPPTLPLSNTDVTASNRKIAMAYGALDQMWQADFRRIGQRFVTPGIARYRGSAYTQCGPMPSGNAVYCPNTNTIYYDEIFIAAMAKMASNALGTDGDMASVGVIAHEMGHAVAMQLGYSSPYSYENESVADCLAGAFAQQSRKDGSLEKGDEEEAFWGMASAADPTPRPTGNVRYDRAIARRMAVMGHGTRAQRMGNFKAGLDGGAGACLEEFR